MPASHARAHQPHACVKTGVMLRWSAAVKKCAGFHTAAQCHAHSGPPERAALARDVVGGVDVVVVAPIALLCGCTRHARMSARACV